MSNMRPIRKARIKLGRVRSDSRTVPRVAPDSRAMLQRFSPREQRVTVKVRQSYNNNEGTWRSHGRYLERDTARFGDGFSQTEEKIDIPHTLAQWQRAGDEKLHKIILSPEFAENVDLKSHTRELMAEVEREIGRPLEWVGMVHKNTDNHHVHIALRGIDRAKEQLDIEEYLGSGVREKSRELLTRQIGPRLYTDILERREKELSADRLTDIDRSLLWKAGETGIVKISHYRAANWKQETSRDQTRRRLTYLTERGLAERVASDSWRLRPDLREKLMRLSLREQLINEKVPGWKFVETLSKSGVIRKRLELGETLTGRVVGVEINDPFGDRKFMLIEGIDGDTYHVNQPRGASDGRVQAGDVITLERRAAETKEREGETATREFNAVIVHPKWEKSWILDTEAVATLRGLRNYSENRECIGFAKQWAEEIRRRTSQLEQLGFDKDSPNRDAELEAIRFSEADRNAWAWNPRDYLPIDTDDSDATLPTLVEDDPNRFVVGEVISSSEQRILVRDLREKESRIVNLKDVGLSWAPSVGTMVSIAAKTLPRTEIRPTDEKIADLLVARENFSQNDLEESESRFVIARANTWVRWGVLRRDEDGTFSLAESKPSPSQEDILSVMERRLEEVRAELTEAARKQPAWLQQLDERRVSLESERFVTLDRLLRDLGPSATGNQASWLGRALTWRKELWEKRGVLLDEHFERTARLWLRDKLLPTTLEKGQTVVGRLVDVKAGEGRYFSIDSADRRIRHFHANERIRERIEEGMLEVGDVLTIEGKSFEKTSNKESREIRYLDVRRSINWRTNSELIRATVDGRPFAPGDDEQERFADEWKVEVEKLSKELKTLHRLEVVRTVLSAGESLTGRVVRLNLDDGERLLLEGNDGKLHLIAQTKRIRDAIAAKWVRENDVVSITAREFESEGRKVSYFDLIRQENWKTSIALEKFALENSQDEISLTNGKVSSDFARAWRVAANKRRELLEDRGVTLEVLEQVERQAWERNGRYAGVYKNHLPETDRELMEVPVGNPLSGKIVEVAFKADGERPLHVALRSEQGDLLFLRPSRGIARAVTEGRIREGDRVTLSTREFSKDEKRLFYTEISHQDTPKRELRGGELLFGRLLSSEIQGDRYIQLDSPEGRLNFRTSQRLRNDIKSGRVRTGDVLVLSTETDTTSDGSSVVRLKHSAPRRWQDTEEFDRAVINQSRGGVEEDRVRYTERGFIRDWRDAVERRSAVFQAEGLINSPNWEEKLKTFRQNELRERLNRPPSIHAIQPHDLRQLSRLEVLFRQATDAGWLVRSEANVLNFVSAAVRAQRARGNVTRVFERLVRAQDWKEIRQQDEDKARLQLISYRERILDGFSVQTPRERDIDRASVQERSAQ